MLSYHEQREDILFIEGGSFRLQNYMYKQLKHTIVNPVKEFFKEHLYLSFFAEAVILTAFIELLSRKGIAGLYKFVTCSPLTFCCNVFIIFLTLALSTLAGSYQRFVHAFIAMIWSVMGVINAIVLRYRMTPFTAEDFHMVPSLVRIARNYLTVKTVVLLVVSIVCLIAALVWMWKKLPKERIGKSWFKRTTRLALAGMGCYAFLLMGMETQAISTDFMNLADAYEEYGFAYCFSTSIVDVGISKPEEYSEELVFSITQNLKSDQSVQQLLNVKVDNVMYENDSEGASAPSDLIWTSASVSSDDTVKTCSAAEDAGSEEKIKPNIIMIQLESFFDPSYLTGYTMSEDPVKNFTSLKKSYASGFLTVPVVGAGTANTEFEILTGMSTDYFGAGEYPYNTVLKDSVTEAIPQILRQYGYTSTAIHNNTGTFYNRDIVFANMGFDRFIPQEYMYNLEKTPNNWAKDAALTDIMMDVLDMSETPDFIYTITVQSHGRYPSEEVLEKPSIRVTKKEDPEAAVYDLEYYVNMIHEVDEMVGDLVARLSARKEPTVLVLFGDHLPALGFDIDDLSIPSLYNTEYVIWNNFDLTIENKEMQAETLGTAVLQLFDMDNGLIPKFHEMYDGTQQYSEYLKTIEYDLFYGEGYALQNYNYTVSDMEIGYKPIRMNAIVVSQREKQTTVSGENFNEFSKIVIDGKEKDTVYVDSKTLILESLPKAMTQVYVGQFDENGKQVGKGSESIQMR